MLFWFVEIRNKHTINDIYYAPQCQIKFDGLVLNFSGQAKELSPSNRFFIL